MAKKFSELENKMSPESKARSDAKLEELNQEMEAPFGRAEGNDQEHFREATCEDALEAIWLAWKKNVSDDAVYDTANEQVNVRVNRYVSFRAYAKHESYKTTIIIEQY